MKIPMKMKPYIIALLLSVFVLAAASCRTMYYGLRPTPVPFRVSGSVQFSREQSQADYAADYQSVNYDRCIILNALNLNYIMEFSQGLAAAQDKNGLWGYVNQKGEWVIEPEYIWACDFENDYAIVEKSEHHILIDNTGAIVLDSRELNGDRFLSGYLDDGSIFLLDDDMGPSGSFSYWSLVDLQGNILIDGKELGLSRISPEYGGYRVAALYNDESGSESFGVLDEQTNWVIEPIYNVINLYDMKSFLVTINNESEKACGMIGIDGEWLLKLDGDMIWSSGSDIIAYHSDMKYYLCDLQGNQLLGGKGFNNIFVFTEDTVMCDDGNGYRPYRLDGSPAYESLGLKNIRLASINTLLGAVEGDGGRWLWGMLDPEGAEGWLLEPRYDSIPFFEGGIGEGVVLVDESDGKVTLCFEKINSSGRVYAKSPEITIGKEAYQWMFTDYYRISD